MAMSALPPHDVPAGQEPGADEDVELNELGSDNHDIMGPMLDFSPTFVSFLLRPLFCQRWPSVGSR
jgi:hypothetical protein